MLNNTTNVYNVCKTSSGPVNEERLLQPLWDLRLGYEEWVSSPLFPVVFSVLAYLGQCLPFMIADLYFYKHKWYLKYKIQPDKLVSMPQIMDTLHLTFWNHMLFILPSALAQWVWVPNTPLPQLAPTLWDFVWQQAASLVIFDFQYYLHHVTHHKVRFLYKHVHSVHHRYFSPFSWVTQYLHPWELITIGLLTTTNTWFFDCHPLTIWSYMLLTITLSVEAHTGFDFPFSLGHLIPFGLYGGALHHDMHHQKPMTNFQPLFNTFDRLFGTHCPPMIAGGIKTKELIQWELRRKETRKQD